MQITFLGTGTSSGVPMIGCLCDVCKSVDVRDRRLRSSVMIQIDGRVIVIDCGPDFRQQMLREEVNDLDAILLTHAHKDHTGGLDDIRAFNYLLQKDIDIFLNEEAKGLITKQYDYIFENHSYPGIPKVQLHLIDDKPFSIKDLEIMPIKVNHYKLPVIAYRIQDFVYITDANDIEPKELEKLKGAKVVVINALRKEKHISHFNLSEAVEILEFLDPTQGFLTHISHQMGLHEEVNSTLPEDIALAYDGLNFEL